MKGEKKKNRKQAEKRTRQHMCKFRPISKAREKRERREYPPTSKAAERLDKDAH